MQTVMVFCYIFILDSQNQLEHEPVLEVRDNNEWNVSIRQKLLEGIQLCCECIQESNSFTEPVDLEAYPDYTSVVPVPIDLSTIIARLQNSFYRFVCMYPCNCGNTQVHEAHDADKKLR